MVFVALAGLSGLVWGLGDFAGGKAAQRASSLSVAWVAKLVSLPLLAVYLAATYVPVPLDSLGWGVAGRRVRHGRDDALLPGALSGSDDGGGSGHCGHLGRDPGRRRPGRGERPPIHQLIGVGCALLAIALVSLAPPPPVSRSWSPRRWSGWRCSPAPASRCSSCSWPGPGSAAGTEPGLWPVAVVPAVRPRGRRSAADRQATHRLATRYVTAPGPCSPGRWT